MIEDFRNFIAREVARQIARNTMGIRFGVVKTYDPAGPSVTVQFADDLDADGNPTVSPPMPIILPAAGPQSGVCAAPQLDAQAIVLSVAYGNDRWMFMLGTVRSSADPAPSDPATDGGPAPRPGTPEGETWMVNGAGPFVKVRAGVVQAGSNGAPFKRFATEDFVLSVFNGHTHKYQPGSGALTNTAPPTTQVATTDTTNLTAIVKGN